MAMVVLAWSASCAANTIEIAPGADLAAQLHALHAGDTLILDDGSYLVNGAVSVTFAGTSAAPIVVRAKDGAHPVVDQVSNQNILDIVDSTFVTLDGITFVHGSRGLRFTGGSDITVQNCVVHDTPYNAIAANDIGYDYARLRFIHNEIYNTGGTAEGFYLGCNDDGCRVHDSLIANNDIHDLNGPTVSQGDGIEIKKGSYANIVRDNVIHDTGYPGITIYDVNGRGAVNIIERNLVWNTGDNGIQVTADAIVRNNIVLSEGAAASAFASNALQNGSAANLTIVNNTFFAAQGDGIHLNSVSGSVRI
ncbi:MAG TPA: right-handed parallel beta-helix repeat-containing protein, partial [Rudaea sp.]